MARGGARKGAGRKPAATAEALRMLQGLAQSHMQLAIDTLVDVAMNGDTSASRVSACNVLLDRGFGRAIQGVDHTSSDGSMSSKPTTISFVSPEVTDEGDD